jgi:hypothetical protein
MPSEDTGSASKSDQVSAHKEAVYSFQRYANGGDAELKEWAEKSCRNWNTIFKWLRTFTNKSHHNEVARQAQEDVCVQAAIFSQLSAQRRQVSAHSFISHRSRRKPPPPGKLWL